MAEIAKVKAIDNHAHPLRVVAEGERPDEEYDALTYVSRTNYLAQVVNGRCVPKGNGFGSR